MDSGRADPNPATGPGPRLRTAGEAEARDFVGRRFREAGLGNVREESFEVATCRPRAAQCELLGVASRNGLACVGLQFTAAGEVESEAVDPGVRLR